LGVKIGTIFQPQKRNIFLFSCRNTKESRGYLRIPQIYTEFHQKKSCSKKRKMQPRKRGIIWNISLWLELQNWKKQEIRTELEYHLTARITELEKELVYVQGAMESTREDIHPNYLYLPINLFPKRDDIEVQSKLTFFVRDFRYLCFNKDSSCHHNQHH
jgi:hypothetical protein